MGQCMPEEYASRYQLKAICGPLALAEGVVRGEIRLSLRLAFRLIMAQRRI
jgi:hypothetical protein